MKKRILTVFILIISTIMLVGCTSTKDNDYDEATLTTNAESVMTILESVDKDTAQKFLDQRDELLEQLFVQNKLPIEAANFKGVLKTWIDSIEDFGAFEQKTNPRFSREQGHNKLTFDAKFHEREADLSFTFDDDNYVTDINVNGHYSTGEIAKKAGLNTLLGMGTVFIMLIFISFVISLFKYLPGNRNPKKPGVDPVPVSRGASQDIKTSDNEIDNNELIAVITAAIAAETNKKSDDFIVRKIRKR